MSDNNYACADGFDNAGALVKFEYQCKNDGIEPGDQVRYPDGSADNVGAKTTRLKFKALSRAGRTVMEARLGVDVDTPSNDVTLRLLVNDNTWEVWNARLYYVGAVRTPFGWSDYAVDVLLVEPAS